MMNVSHWEESSKAFETEVHHFRPPFLAATIEYLPPLFVVLFCTPKGIIPQNSVKSEAPQWSCNCCPLRVCFVLLAKCSPLKPPIWPKTALQLVERGQMQAHGACTRHAA